VRSYAAPKGKPLQLTVYTPKQASGQPTPCLLLIHGGGWTFGTRHQMRWYGARFAEQGYVAVSVDYRKLPSHGFRDSVEDVKSAVRWLRANADMLGIDAKRIVAMGNSAGGHLAMMLATTVGHPVLDNPEQPARIHAAVSLYGALDMTVYKDPPLFPGFDVVGQGLIERYVEEGLPGFTDPYVAASPLTHAGADTPPVLLIQGGGDKLVPPWVAHEAYADLYALKVPVRLHLFPGQPHAFDFLKPQLRPEVFSLILDFLHDNGCAPAPAGEAISHGGV
jgi:acetyl esterase/lipase